VYTSLQLLEICLGVEVLLLGIDQGLPCSSCWLVLIDFWCFFGKVEQLWLFFMFLLFLPLKLMSMNS
jgi:hypothetical protein